MHKHPSLRASFVPPNTGIFSHKHDKLLWEDGPRSLLPELSRDRINCSTK
uniref:Uncharacterized protein n=1 Tax=Anguilla anguilla TaxID=7936 RepID=A0A0E9WFH8_ANGAN